MTVVECPVDDCDYSGLPESVAGHYSGKRDKAHQGTFPNILKELKRRQAVKESGDGSGDEGGSNPPAEDAEMTPSKAAATATTDGGASNASAVEFPENPDADDDDVDDVEDEPTCPDCGSNYYALVEDHADELRANGDEWVMDDGYTHICAECTEVYRDE